LHIQILEYFAAVFIPTIRPAVAPVSCQIWRKSNPKTSWYLDFPATAFPSVNPQLPAAPSCLGSFEMHARLTLGPDINEWEPTASDSQMSVSCSFLPLPPISLISRFAKCNWLWAEY